jgi:hypothetical protein
MGDDPPAWADRVLAYSPVTVLGWPYSTDQNLAIGPPGGPADVLRLGDGGSAIFGFGDGSARQCIVDRDGADFVIYSSAIPVIDPIDGPGTLSQVVLVEVSPDGAAWYLFPIRWDTQIPTVDPARYQAGLAGVTPTIGTGSAAGGGDAFDLADVPSLGGMACAMRVTDAWGVVPDYGDTQPDSQGGAGIDTILALHAVPAPATLP